MKRIFPIALLVAVAMVMPAMASPATAHTPVNLLDSDPPPSAGHLLVDGTVSFAIRASFSKSGQKRAFRAGLKKAEELVVEYLIVDKKPENALKKRQLPRLVVTSPSGKKIPIKFTERTWKAPIIRSTLFESF